MGAPCSLARRFGRADAATSAIEFAIIFPVLLVLLLLGWQAVLYINAARKVEQVAASISEMISQATPPSSATTIATVNSLDLHFSYDSSLVIFPFIMRDAALRGIAWWQDIQIDYASIQFTQTSTSCAGQADQSSCYLATVLWTSSGTSGTNNRPCIVPQVAANDTATPSNTTLPRSLFGPGSIIAIDVVYTYTPRFAAALLPPVKITKSVFVQPRYASVIQYDTTNNDGIAVKCS